MLTQPQLHEATRLRDRLLAGSVSREDWSNLAALLLMVNGDLCIEIAADSLDAFVARAQPIYYKHAFRYDDYRRIYERVCETAQRVQRDRVAH